MLFYLQLWGGSKEYLAHLGGELLISRAQFDIVLFVTIEYFVISLEKRLLAKGRRVYFETRCDSLHSMQQPEWRRSVVTSTWRGRCTFGVLGSWWVLEQIRRYLNGWTACDSLMYECCLDETQRRCGDSVSWILLCIFFAFRVVKISWFALGSARIFLLGLIPRSLLRETFIFTRYFS